MFIYLVLLLRAKLCMRPTDLAHEVQNASFSATLAFSAVDQLSLELMYRDYFTLTTKYTPAATFVTPSSYLTLLAYICSKHGR
jgi:hypothetical protein